MKKIFSILALAAMFAACSSQENPVSEDEGLDGGSATSSSSEYAKVRFSVGSLSTKSVSTKDDDSTDVTTTEEGEVQTAEEKAVTSLLVVIFTDVDKDVATSGETDTEADSDTYYSYMSVTGIDSDTALDEDSEYEIEIRKDGRFQIVFIANPSTDLVADIAALVADESTIEDFKTILVEDDPATKPMPMTSTHFYGIITSEDTDLETIYLERIMSRIDIVNLAEDITIDSAVLKQRSYTTDLIRDNAGTWGSEYIGADVSYTIGIEGDADQTDGLSEYEKLALIDEGVEGAEDLIVNAYKAEIYSFEQYGEDAYIPSVELTYHIGSDTETIYKHEVPFTYAEDVTDDEGNTYTAGDPVYLKRNTRYIIVASYTSAENLSFSISVADWVDDIEFVVTREEVDENAARVESLTCDEDLVWYSVSESSTAITVTALAEDGSALAVTTEDIEISYTYDDEDDTDWLSATFSSSTATSSVKSDEDPTLTLVLTAAAWSDSPRTGSVTVTHTPSGESFSVDVRQANLGKDDYTAEIGGFVLSDGAICGASTMQEWAGVVYDEDTGATIGESAIAIIFYVNDDQDRMGDSTKEAGYTVGKAFSLNNAASGSTPCIWSTDTSTDFDKLLNTTTFALAYSDVVGLANTQAVTSSSSYSATVNYAFAYCLAYEDTVPTPDNTSDWYIPAIGEWFDILENLGGLDLSTLKTDTTNSTYTITDGHTKAADAMNEKMAYAGDGNYTAISCSGTAVNWFPSSSEGSASTARTVEFRGDKGYLGFYNDAKTSTGSNGRLRAALAF